VNPIVKIFISQWSQTVRFADSATHGLLVQADAMRVNKIPQLRGSPGITEKGLHAVQHWLAIRARQLLTRFASHRMWATRHAASCNLYLAKNFATDGVPLACMEMEAAGIGTSVGALG